MNRYFDKVFVFFKINLSYFVYVSNEVQKCRNGGFGKRD
jgi:hypothetical protein